VDEVYRARLTASNIVEAEMLGKRLLVSLFLLAVPLGLSGCAELASLLDVMRKSEPSMTIGRCVEPETVNPCGISAPSS
jgi:hypothetical protein